MKEVRELIGVSGKYILLFNEIICSIDALKHLSIQLNIFAMKGRNFKQSMLEYCKIILVKISFDRRLFRKEYRKTFSYLDTNEHMELK